MVTFWNRSSELGLIKRKIGHSGFGYVTGRRRVGKTALLKKACDDFGGIYHQAVEGTPAQQLIHLAEEISQQLPIFRGVIPRTWAEFFTLLGREKLAGLLVFDEFSYWAQADPSMPSILQKWLDHELSKTKTLLLVSGSSQSMLYSHFLDQGAPLYGRADMHLHLKPLTYGLFCRALGYPISDPNSFARFSLVGGVPRYWNLIPKGGILDQADALYFDLGAILADEPHQILSDEGVTGAMPKAILDLIGRGVAKPSELAGRLGTPQGNLSRPLALLLELGLVERDLPFGESLRTTKKVLYAIIDPALAFYYGTHLPARSRWANFDLNQKKARINDHAGRIWESFCRQAYPGSGRYWEGRLEIDLVAFLRGEKEALVAECKWAALTPAQEWNLLEELKGKFNQTSLSRRLKRVKFRVFSKKDLAYLSSRVAEKMI